MVRADFKCTGCKSRIPAPPNVSCQSIAVTSLSISPLVIPLPVAEHATDADDHALERAVPLATPAVRLDPVEHAAIAQAQREAIDDQPLELRLQLPRQLRVAAAERHRWIE